MASAAAARADGDGGYAASSSKSSNTPGGEDDEKGSTPRQIVIVAGDLQEKHLAMRRYIAAEMHSRNPWRKALVFGADVAALDDGADGIEWGRLSADKSAAERDALLNEFNECRDVEGTDVEHRGLLVNDEFGEFVTPLIQSQFEYLSLKMLFSSPTPFMPPS